MSAVQKAARKPFRLLAPMIAEDDLHFTAAQLLDRVVAPPAMWTCFPAGNVPLPPQYATKLARMGLKRGFPDLLIFHEWAHGIELKRTDGKLSKTRTVRTKKGALRVLEGQEDVFPRLIAAGMQIEVCRSPEEIMAALRRWGIPLRGGLSVQMPMRVTGGLG
jgi:hypothetical protein